MKRANPRPETFCPTIGARYHHVEQGDITILRAWSVLEWFRGKPRSYATVRVHAARAAGGFVYFDVFMGDFYEA